MLYHYYNKNNFALDTLINNQIWLSSFSKLNDPVEYLIAVFYRRDFNWNVLHEIKSRRGFVGIEDEIEHRNGNAKYAIVERHPRTPSNRFEMYRAYGSKNKGSKS